jgi:hypothetical protein
MKRENEHVPRKDTVYTSIGMAAHRRRRVAGSNKKPSICSGTFLRLAAGLAGSLDRIAKYWLIRRSFR